MSTALSLSLLVLLSATPLGEDEAPTVEPERRFVLPVEGLPARDEGARSRDFDEDPSAGDNATQRCATGVALGGTFASLCLSGWFVVMSLANPPELRRNAAFYLSIAPFVASLIVGAGTVVVVTRGAPLAPVVLGVMPGLLLTALTIPLTQHVSDSLRDRRGDPTPLELFASLASTAHLCCYGPLVAFGGAAGIAWPTVKERFRERETPADVDPSEESDDQASAMRF